MSTAITIDAVTKTYAPGAPPAVDAVSLRITPGELFFLLGPSGCGKTTLLRMIAGFIEPTAGRIRFGTAAGELDVTHVPPNRRNTGMVFQSYALWPHMTVAQNVAFGLDVRKIPKAEAAARVAEALAMVEMAPYAQRRPNALSGGQQQRVALARALVVRPAVLLLDEPLSNLDARLRVELRSEIRRICKASGLTTIYVTHDQKEALSMADRVAIMSAGRVVQSGPPGELYRRPQSRFVAEFLGETNLLPATVAGSTLQTAAGPLASAHTPPAGGAALVVSLRPEALRIHPGHAPAAAGAVNRLRGRIVDTMYLGELAQHTVELAAFGAAAPQRVKVADLNPAPPAATPSPGEPAAAHDVTLTVEPHDVVLLPA